MKNKLLTKELLEQYKKHPRILEVRFILLFDLFEKEFGYNGVMDIFNGLCIGFKRNKQVLDTVIDKRFDIKRKSKTSVTKWRQEVMFMGACYGDTIYRIATDYLMIDPSNLYKKEKKNMYDVNTFVTDEWLRSLDDEVKVTGGILHRNEVKGFLEIMDSLTSVLMRWKGSGDN